MVHIHKWEYYGGMIKTYYGGIARKYRYRSRYRRCTKCTKEQELMNYRHWGLDISDYIDLNCNVIPHKFKLRIGLILGGVTIFGLLIFLTFSTFGVLRLIFTFSQFIALVVLLSVFWVTSIRLILGKNTDAWRQYKYDGVEK